MVKSFSPVELDQLLHTASQRKRPHYESQNASSRMRWYFVFFVVSGFCSLVYEVVWLRLAMASFGVTTAMVSIVVSMFMAGLGLGSWGTGVLVRRVAAAPRMLRFYALAEFLVGISALFRRVAVVAVLLLVEPVGSRHNDPLVYLHGFYVPSPDGSDPTNARC